MFVFHGKLILGQSKRDFPKEEGGGDPLDNGQLLDGDSLTTWQDLLLEKYASIRARQGPRQVAAHYAFNYDRYLSWAVQVRDRWPGGVNEYNLYGPSDEGVRVCNLGGVPIHPLNIKRIHGVMPRDMRPLRTYYIEPLEVAREVLRTEGTSPYWRGNGNWMVDIYDGVGDHKPWRERDFENWHLTNDFSLLASYQDYELEKWLRQHKRCAERDGSRLSTKSSVPAFPPSPDRTPKWVSATGGFIGGPATITSTNSQLQGAISEGRSIGPSLSVERAIYDLLDSVISGQPLRKASRKRKRVAEDDSEEESRERSRLGHSPSLRPKQTVYPDVDECKCFSSKRVLPHRPLTNPQGIRTVLSWYHQSFERVKKHGQQSIRRVKP